MKNKITKYKPDDPDAVPITTVAALIAKHDLPPDEPYGLLKRDPI